MNEQDILDYLESHPDFFSRHAASLNKLKSCHTHTGRISLAEAQLKQQRKQISTLTAQLEKLHQLAIQEADIFFALIPLQKKIISSTGFSISTKEIRAMGEIL